MTRITSFSQLKTTSPKPTQRTSPKVRTKTDISEAVLEIAKLIDPQVFQYDGLDPDELEVIRDDQQRAIKKATECFRIAKRHLNKSRRFYFMRTKGRKATPEYVLRVVTAAKQFTK